MNPLHVLSFPRIRRDHEAQTEGLKARQIIAQGKRRNASAALGNQSKTNQALEGRQKLFPVKPKLIFHVVAKPNTGVDAFMSK